MHYSFLCFFFTIIKRSKSKSLHENGIAILSFVVYKIHLIKRKGKRICKLADFVFISEAQIYPQEMTLVTFYF